MILILVLILNVTVTSFYLKNCYSIFHSECDWLYFISVNQTILKFDLVNRNTKRDGLTATPNTNRNFTLTRNV